MPIRLVGELCYSVAYRTSGMILARRMEDEPCQDGNVAAISLPLRVLRGRQPERHLATDDGVRLLIFPALFFSVSEIPKPK